MGSMVAMGSPVRWVRIHPILRAAFSWPMLVGAIPVKGTRRFAELALPHLVRRLPWLLSIYLNPSITDTDAAREMVKTVEDPNRHINREIARWIRDRDLVLRGINVSEALPQMKNPLLCVVANGDGIVPRATAEFPYARIGATSKRLLEVGSEAVSMAHADMFVSNEAHARVFCADRNLAGRARHALTALSAPAETSPPRRDLSASAGTPRCSRCRRR
jgi:hypothetical protein